MTSKSSFWKISRINSKKRFPFFIICFLVCFFIMPVITYVDVMNAKAILEMYGPIALNETFYNMRLISLPPLEGCHGILTAALALLLAITGWSWNNQIKKVDFYKALPVKESVRWWYINLNNLFIFMICYGINLILSNIVLACGGFYSPTALKVSLVGFLVHTLLFIAVYMIICIAQLLTGNFILAALGGCYLVVLEPLIRFMIYALSDSFFKTYSHLAYLHDGIHVLEKGILTPIAPYINAVGYRFNTNKVYFADNAGLVKGIVILCIQIAVYGFIAYKLYRARASYAGNNNIAFGFAKPIIKCIIMIPAIVFAALGFYVIHSDGNGFMIFGFISGVVISQILLQYLIEGDFKCVIKGIRSAVVSTVIAAVIVIIFTADVFGYDRYVPEADEVESFAVIYDSDIYSDYLEDDGEYVPYGQYLMNHMKLTDKQLLSKLTGYISESLSEDKYNENNYDGRSYGVGVTVKYETTSGKTITRSYVMANGRGKELYRDLYNNRDYVDAHNPLKNNTVAEKISDNNVHISAFYDSFVDFDYNSVHFEEGDILPLFDAIQKDMDARKADDVTDGNMIGEVCVYIEPRVERYDYYSGSYSTNLSFAVYDCDAYMLKLLEKYEYDITEPNWDEVERFEVTKYDYDSGQSYSGNIEKDDPMFETLKGMVIISGNYGTSSVPNFDVYNNDLNVSAVSNNRYLHFYLREGEYPEGLDDKLKPDENRLYY